MKTCSWKQKKNKKHYLCKVLRENKSWYQVLASQCDKVPTNWPIRSWLYHRLFQYVCQGHQMIKKQLSHDRGRDPGPFLELSKRVMSVRVKSCPCSAFGLGHRQADKADMTMWPTTANHISSQRQPHWYRMTRSDRIMIHEVNLTVLSENGTLNVQTQKLSN